MEAALSRYVQAGEAPLGWPPNEGGNNEETHSMGAKHTGTEPPPGYFEIHARDDMKRIAVRAGSVLTVIEMANAKDGCKIVVVGNTFYHADESYETVVALLAEARLKEDRGF